MATNRVRINGQWVRTEDGAQRVVIPFETGHRTFTESIEGTIQLTSNTTGTISMQTLSQGNHLYVQCSTGPMLIIPKAGVGNASYTHSVTLLSGGFVVYGYVTFAAVKYKNKATTTSTLKYYIAGD
jgi:hypothetical protein